MTHAYMPQAVCGAAWYYENDGSIDIIMNPADLGVSVIKEVRRRPSVKSGIVWADSNGICLRIPSNKLLATLIRQGKVQP